MAQSPVPVVDVLRAAMAEVEDYARVNVMPVADISLDGAAVADITHLVAELIENATDPTSRRRTVVDRTRRTWWPTGSPSRSRTAAWA